jgi:hypothetical protein
MPVSIAVFGRFREELKKQFDFKADVKNGLCREIQAMIYGRSFTMTDPKEREAFEAAGGHTAQGCPKVCGIAAEVAAEKLSEIAV